MTLNARLRAASLEPVSVERFRANVVLAGIEAHDEDRLDVLHVAGDHEEELQLKPVKPCARCPIPNIDPVTAISSPSVGDTLQTYRQDARHERRHHLRHERHLARRCRAVAARGAESVSADYVFD